VRPDAIARVAISSVAVASGTGAFLALATGHRGPAIALALIGGFAGLTAAFGQALEREHDHPAALVPGQPAVVGTAAAAGPVVSGFMGGRMMGRG
jgi:hypothetical protein